MRRHTKDINNLHDNQLNCYEKLKSINKKRYSLINEKNCLYQNCFILFLVEHLMVNMHEIYKIIIVVNNYHK